MIACSSCFGTSNWNGGFQVVKCPHCGRSVDLARLALSLVRLFCEDAANADTGKACFEQQLFQGLAKTLWAKGNGRQLWWYVGCPTTLEEIRALLQSGDDQIVSPLI